MSTIPPIRRRHDLMPPANRRHIQAHYGHHKTPTTNHQQENTMSNRPTLDLTVTGYAAADAEVKFLANGTPVANVSVPYTPRRKNDQTGQWEDAGDTTWVRIAVWRDDAELFAEQVHKGTMLTVTGRPNARAYMTKNGEPGVSLEVSADQWAIIPRRTRGQHGGYQQRPQASAFDQSATAGGQAGDPWATTAF